MIGEERAGAKKEIYPFEIYPFYPLSSIHYPSLLHNYRELTLTHHDKCTTSGQISVHIFFESMFGITKVKPGPDYFVTVMACSHGSQFVYFCGAMAPPMFGLERPPSSVSVSKIQ